MKNEFFYCFRSILLGLKLNYEFLKMIRVNEIRKIVKKILKILEFTHFSLGEFAIESNCESEANAKAVEKLRSESEAKSIPFCAKRSDANSLRFAIFRNRANSHCEFGALTVGESDAST